MILVKANLKLYYGEKARQTPFTNGYRPLFNFGEDMKTSGQINLIDKNEFSPGENGVVEIAFLNDEYLGKDFNVGTKFSFGEGKIPLGEGEIIEILEK
jgi:translation elongation factor EF-Tu-like GTPase